MKTKPNTPKRNQRYIDGDIDQSRERIRLSVDAKRQGLFLDKLSNSFDDRREKPSKYEIPSYYVKVASETPSLYTKSANH